MVSSSDHNISGPGIAPPTSPIVYDYLLIAQEDGCSINTFANLQLSPTIV